MRVLLVNAVCGIGSTGRICTDIHDMLVSKGHTCMVAFAHSEPIRISAKDTYRINNKVGYYIHNVIARLTDRAGFYSNKATKRFIEFIKSYKPDIIHLHNLHGFYINIRLLFEYLSSVNIPIVWTLHDCWAFTGHCSHYSYYGCNKWMTMCHKCPLKKEYPQSIFFDNSIRNYRDKKNLFTSINKLQIITPSKWLAGEVGKSFLSKYPIKAIYNGIDLSIFKPTSSSIISKLGISKNKIILLAVANEWSRRKGLDDLLGLNETLDYNKYQLVIVGLSEEKLQSLPNSIIGLGRTDSLDELIELYSAADIFINPSYEETMGMVSAEALACGTPVISYDKTAVPEIADEASGIVVPAGNIDAIAEAIPKALLISRANCRKRAHIFEINQQYELYYNVYCKLLDS